MKLLIVEDEVALRTAIASFFKSSGEIVVATENLFDAEDKLRTNFFDLVVLDITLPDGSGIELIPIIKQTQENAGILILSAKNSLDDKINGLDRGADDYLTKPFHIAELNSRVKALLRRNVYHGESLLQFNSLQINLAENQVYNDGRLIELTKKEFSLLLYFAHNKNRILTKEAIAEHLWGESIDGLDNFDFIYTHIKNLRKKIVGSDGFDFLKTVHGIGYKFTSP